MRPKSATDEMMDLVKKCERALREAYNPEGFNLGMNLGQWPEPAFADHIHMHLVPAGAAIRISCRLLVTRACCRKTWQRPTKNCAAKSSTGVAAHRFARLLLLPLHPRH
jgi:diadenosine tetraphosphate (Ap4A) HIT family hydrolase